MITTLFVGFKIQNLNDTALSGHVGYSDFQSGQSSNHFSVFENWEELILKYNVGRNTIMGGKVEI